MNFKTTLKKIGCFAFSSVGFLPVLRELGHDRNYRSNAVREALIWP